MGSVTVERRKAVWRDRARAYVVTIDGEPVGKLASGEKQTFPLTPGAHDVGMKIDWCGSPRVTVDGASDSRLVCDATGTALTVLFDIVFRAGNYISLKFA
ncbi:MAG: hypothetical protein ABIT16_08215 [Croceibacterium sp.]